MSENDDFLRGLRGRPSGELEERIRARLRAEGQAGRAPGRAPAMRRLRVLLLAAAAVAVAAGCITSPAIRSSARAFLDLFRVRNFAAIQVDPARLRQLETSHIDVKSLLGDRVEELEKPGPMRAFREPRAAAAAAAFAVREPRTLPRGLALDTVLVHGASRARVTIDAARLRSALDALGLTDVHLPPNLDGAQAMVRMPSAVILRYRKEGREVQLAQAPSPEIELPKGLDLRQLGEIGLRVAGLSESEARRFAATIDWGSTVLMPVPADVASFVQVDVHGRKALLITRASAVRGPRGRPAAMLLWSEDQKVYALCGNVPSAELVLMANSVQ